MYMLWAWLERPSRFIFWQKFWKRNVDSFLFPVCSVRIYNFGNIQFYRAKKEAWNSHCRIKEEKIIERFKRIRETDERAPCHDCCNIGGDGCRRNFRGGCILSGAVRMKEAANRGKGKMLLISAGIEIMLIICITAANLNPTPIRYFIFCNLLYGLVFSLLIPLYCLYKENGASVSGRVLAEVGFKKPGIRQWGVLAAFVVFSIGG